MTQPGSRLMTAEFDGQVDAIAFSPDSRRVAFGGDSTTVPIRSLGPGQQASLATQSSSVSCIAFSPDGATVAVADRDEIKVYDSVAGGDPLWSGLIEASVSINFVAFTPDASAVIAVTDTVVVVLDTNTQTELSRFEVEIQIADIDISADGKLIALAIDQNHGGNHQNVGSAQVWDWAQKTKTLQVTPQNAVFTVALSPDSPTSMLLLSSADNSNQIVLLDDTAEPLWIEGGEEDKQQGKETVGASHTAFGPKAKNVILGDSWGLARVLDAESGIQRSRSEHNGAVTHVALMANRKWAASTGIDNILVVFNAESAGQLYTASTLEATAMAVSPNSRYVALGHLGSFVVYDNGETA